MGTVGTGRTPLTCQDATGGTGEHVYGRVDGELAAVVTGRPDAGGYRVEPDGGGGFREAALAAIPLPGAGR